MNIKLLTILICLQCYFSCSVYALDCDNELQMKEILAQVNLDYDSSVLLSCKPHPQNKEQILIAYAVQKPPIEDIGIGDFQLYILSLNNKSNHISYFYPVEQTLISDAVELYGIDWDFAPFVVKPNHRAVGLRLKYSLRSQVHPYSTIVLNLYDLDNKKQILDSLIVDEYNVDTDTRCNADIKERNSILVMQPTTTYGYFDIQVRSQLDYYEMSGNEDHCIEINRKTSKQNFLIKFNGLRYVIPTSYKKDYQY